MKMVLFRSHQKSSGRKTITWLQRKWSFYDRICSNSAVHGPSNSTGKIASVSESDKSPPPEHNDKNPPPGQQFETLQEKDPDLIDSEEFLDSNEGGKIPVKSIDDDESDVSSLGDADYQELDEKEIESMMTYRDNKENHEADIQREDVEFREHSTDIGQNGSINKPACVVNTTPDKGACITEESGSMFQFGNSGDEHPVYVKSKDQVDAMVRKAVEIGENPANELPTDKSTISPIKSCDVVDSFENIQSEIGADNAKNNANNKGKAKKSANKKVYTCDVCFKVFESSGHLKEHMVVHTGLKPDVEYKSRKIKFSDIKDKTVLKSSTNGGISDTVTVKKKLSYKCKRARTEINAGLEKADNEVSKNINSNICIIDTDAELENSDHENNVCTRQSSVPSEKQDLIKPVMDSRPERAILSPENKPVTRPTHVHSKTHNKVITTKVKKDNSIKNNKPIKIHENAVRKEKHSRKKITSKAEKTCSYCKRIFKSAHEVYRHLVVHTKEKRFKCLYCPEKFLWVERRTKHVRLQHPHEKTITAVKERTAMELKPSRTTEKKKRDLIKKENKKKGPLKLVIKITRPTQNKQDSELKCSYCKKKFKEVRYLRDHIWIHTKIKRYRCTACNERFYRRVPNHQKRCPGLAKGIQCKVVQMDKYRNMTIAQLYQHIEPNMESKVGLDKTKHLKSNDPGDGGKENEISDNGDSEDFDEEEKQEKESSDEADYWTHAGHKRVGDRTEGEKEPTTKRYVVSGAK